MKRLRNLTQFFIVIDELGGQEFWQALISGELSIKSKKSLGSTHPREVVKAIRREEKWLNEDIKDEKRRK